MTTSNMNSSFENSDYVNFKQLLEYFVAHLEHVAETPNKRGYSQYRTTAQRRQFQEDWTRIQGTRDSKSNRGMEGLQGELHLHQHSVRLSNSNQSLLPKLERHLRQYNRKLVQQLYRVSHNNE